MLSHFASESPKLLPLRARQLDRVCAVWRAATGRNQDHDGMARGMDGDLDVVTLMKGIESKPAYGAFLSLAREVTGPVVAGNVAFLGKDAFRFFDSSLFCKEVDRAKFGL